MISASRCQATMLCHSVRSCHSPPLSLKRSLVARLNLATAVPLGVYLTSGSLPRLPTRITLLTLFAMKRLFLLLFSPPVVACVKFLSIYIAALAVLRKPESHARAIYFVQHYINHHAGHGNIKPDRKSPARDPAMAIKSLAQPQSQGRNHQRHHGRR